MNSTRAGFGDRWEAPGAATPGATERRRGLGVPLGLALLALAGLVAGMALLGPSEDPSSAERKARALAAAREPDADLDGPAIAADLDRVIESASDRRLAREGDGELAESDPERERPDGREDEVTEEVTEEELAEFRAYVDATLGEMRDEKAQDMNRDIERSKSSLDADMARWEDLLELSPQQSKRLRTEILSQLELEGEYVWQWRQGVDPEALEELKGRDRAAHRQRVAEFLTPAQLAKYDSRR